jgi:DNA topoisomerase III
VGVARARGGESPGLHKRSAEGRGHPLHARGQRPLVLLRVIVAGNMRGDGLGFGTGLGRSVGLGYCTEAGGFGPICIEMGNTVILAKKPSVARETARVLGCRQQGNGYVAGNGCIVTWAVGHLVGLAQPHEVNVAWKVWSLAALPMVPTEWLLSVSAWTRDQFDVVKRLMNAQETEAIVCATDAGREGELIFRNIYDAAGCTKPVQRLWISSLTEEAIRAGLGRLRPSSEYDCLAAAARGRARADWLVGLNLTRAYSPRGGIVSVGRVQTPTLAMIVERDLRIAGFVPEAYGEVEALFRLGTGDGYTGTLVRRDAVAQILDGVAREPGATESVCRVPAGTKVDPGWEGAGAIVERAVEERHRECSPLLYDLTELQRHANRVFGMSAQETLDVAQRLYEQKLLTYPRTDSRYVAADVGRTLGSIATSVEQRFGSVVRPGTCSSALPARFVNDAKVTDHHAILPTSRMVSGAELSGNDARVYDLVCRRLVSCWLAEYISAITTVLTWTAASDGKDLWLSKGTVVVQQGWKGLEPAPGREDRDGDAATDGSLPPGLVRGMQSRVEAVRVVKKKTRPPARLTEASLLTAMESAGKTLVEAELSEAMRERGLGTPATRAAIIELLVSRGYTLLSRLAN